MKRRILSALLVICMLFTMVVPSVAYTDEKTYDAENAKIPGTENDIPALPADEPEPAKPTQPDEEGGTKAQVTWYTYEDWAAVTKYQVAYEITEGDMPPAPGTVEQFTNPYEASGPYYEGETYTFWIKTVVNSHVTLTQRKNENIKTYMDWDGTDFVTSGLVVRYSDTAYSYMGDQWDIIDGSLRVYFPDGTSQLVDIAADGYASVQWTVPTSVTNTGAEVKDSIRVQFLANADNLGDYMSAGDKTTYEYGTSVWTSAEKVNDLYDYAAGVEFLTRTLNGADASIVATPALAVGGDSVLSVSGIKDMQGKDVTLDTAAYDIDWYTREGLGAEWVFVGTSDTATATPEDAYREFKAVVKPTGAYAYGEFEVTITGATLLTPTAANATFTKASGLLGETVDVTVEILAGTTAAESGTVTLLENGTTVVAQAEIINGTAALSYVPTAVGTYTYTVNFSGIDGVMNAVNDLAVADTYTVTENRIDQLATAWELTPAGDLTPGTEVTLAITNDGGLTFGNEYTVAWQISYDGGLTWADLFGGAQSNDITVTPADAAIQYRAVVTPLGFYTATNGAIILTKGCGTNKAVATTTLTVNNATPFENEKITLTAYVTANISPEGGAVEFIDIDGVTVLGKMGVDAAGYASITIDAPAYGTAVTYTANYLGTASLAASSATVDVTSKSVTIQAGGTDIIVDTTDIKQGIESVLSIPAVTSLDGDALTYGTHYTVRWYVNYGDGEYVEIYGADTLTVKPESPYESYMAVVVPVTGVGSNYTTPASGIALNATTAAGDAGLFPTTVEISLYDQETDAAVVNPVEGDVITVMALVKRTGAAGAEEIVTDGTVTFAVNGNIIGTVAVGANGYASLSNVIALNNAVITATYNRTKQNEASTGTHTIASRSTEIELAANAITVYENGTDVTNPTNNYEVLVDYELAIPEVYATDAVGTALTVGRDFLVSWYKFNDGAWETMHDRTTITTIEVNAEDTTVSYKATIYPIGDYTVPVEGITTETVNFETKQAVKVALVATPDTAREGSEIILTATVAEDTTAADAVNYGDVAFYRVDASGDVYLGVVTLNASGIAEITTVLPEYVETDATHEVTYKAVYLANEIYDTAEVTATVNQISTAIVWGASNDVIIYAGDSATGTPVTDMQAGQTYTLAAPDVFATDDDVNPLTAGTDYTVRWYVNEAVGASDNWKLVTETLDNGTTIRIDPDKTNYSYMAVITPAGEYNQAWDGTAHVAALTTAATGKTAYTATNTTLTAAPAEEYEGENITLTATVVEDGTATAVMTGSVEFYRNYNGAADEYLGTADIDASGNAVFVTELPEWITTATVEYYAVYLTNDAYETSTSTVATVAQKSTAIVWEAGNDVIIYAGDSATGTPVTEMQAGQTYTLEIPAVVSRDGKTTLTAGVDYIVEWYVNEAVGTSGNWDLVSDTENNGTTIRVDPDKTNYSYKALVYAADAKAESEFTVFDKAWDGTKYAAYLTTTITGKTVYTETETDLVVAPTEQYEHESVTLTATVDELGTDIAVMIGSVEFYRNYGTETDVYVGTANIDASGNAILVTTLPEWQDGDDTVEYYAVYLTNDSFLTSTSAAKEVTILSEAIMWEASSAIIIHEGETKSGAVVTEMHAGQTYTLEIPTVVSRDNKPVEAGKDYIVKWYVNESATDTDNWALVTETDDNGTTIRIDPDKINYSYKALVYAADAVEESAFTTFDKAWQNGAYKAYLETDVLGKTIHTETTTEIAILALAGDDIAEAANFVDAADHLAQFEGKQVKLVATVTETVAGVNVNEGYVDFYNNGVKLNESPVAVNNGKAEFIFKMSEYDEAAAAADNFDTLSATYLVNSTYATSASADAKIYIKSTAIDVPTITSSVASLTTGADSTTKTDTLDGLPAGVKIEFTHSIILATDGREIEAQDYSIIWQMATNSFDAYAFADQEGETADTYKVDSGIVGNSYRLSVIAKGDMTEGAFSLQANIGEKETPAVAVDAVTVFDTTTAAGFKAGVEVIDGSHYGDNVTINVTVTAPAGQLDRPTGYVKLTYTNNDDGTTGEIATVALTEHAEDALASIATYTTATLPEGKLEIKAEYLGDLIYNANSNTEIYKVWSVELDAVTIVADPADSPLIADETYTITLQPVYTLDGQLLAADEYTTTWQFSSDNGLIWQVLTSESGRTVIEQTPATEYYCYRAIVTTTTELYNHENTTLESVEISNVIGSTRNETSIEVIASAPSVYQSNEITLYAVTPDPLTGWVEFYYTDYREDGDYSAATWTPVESTDANGDNTKLLEAVPGTTDMMATIVTDSLPVSADGTYRKLVFKSEYLGDSTYKPVNNIVSNVLNSDMVIVYSSVISEPMIKITVNGGKLIADKNDTILELDTIVTLDYIKSELAADIYTLDSAEDYTIEWQYCESYSANLENWQTLADSTNNHSVMINPVEGYAYRVKITARADSEKVKESYYTDQVYYSNILIVDNAEADITVAVSPTSSAAYDKDDITFTVTMVGGETTPNGLVKLVIKDKATGTVVKEFENNTINSMVTFVWEDAPAGEYVVETTATPNNGYNGFEGVTYTDVQDYIILYREPGIVAAETKTVVYNGQIQNYTAADVEITGINPARAAEAESELVFLCYNAAGELVEAKDAGIYTVKIYLPQSKYWEENTKTVTLVIEQREVSVLDIETQNKIYNGDTAVNVYTATLEDAESAQTTTGLPTNNTGVIHGDVVYAVGTATTASAAAGDTTVTFNFEKFEGPDAGNYKMVGTYSEPITIERNQLKGEIADVTLVYDEEATELTLDKEDVYLIDQAGNEYKDYTLTYYYHDGTGIKLVDAIQKAGKYTVIASGDDNYKGGATGTVYVTDIDGAVEDHGTIDKTAYGSALVYITNAQQTYGAVTGVTAKVTSGTVATVEYLVNGTYTATVPQNVGRYIVKVTASTGDYAYGVFTVYQSAAPVVIPAVPGKIYDNTPVAVANAADFPAGTYFSYVGGQLTEVSYEAPSDAGTYTVTAHIPESANTAVTEYSSTFTIDKRLLTVRAENAYAEMYVNNPVWDLRFENLANGDSSIRDLIAQPQVDVIGYDPHAIGGYTLVCDGAISDNYIFEYIDTEVSVIAHDPQEPLKIYGEPDGTIYYGDEFTLTLYGNTGEYYNTALTGYNTNNSSDIYWSVVPDAGFVGNVTIDAVGNVDVDGVGTFTVTAVRGNGDLAIYKTKTFTAEKKVIDVIVPDKWFVYNAADQSIVFADLSYVGLINGDTVAEADVTFYNNIQKNVGSYVVTAELENDYYVGTGAGLLTITHKDAEVVITSTVTMTYGDAVPAATFTHTESGNAGSDTLINGGASEAYIYSTTDTGVYALVNGNWTENANYHISYVNDATITSNKKDVTIVTGSLADTEHNSMVNVIGGTFEHIGDRMFGEENQIMDFEVDATDKFAALDNLADLDLTNIFVDYTRTIASDANRKFDDRNAQVDPAIDDRLYDITTGTITAENYIVTIDIGMQNIYQRPYTLDIEDDIPVFYGEDAIQAIKDATEVLMYNGIGGLAIKLNHTIDDLNLIFTCTNGPCDTKASEGTVFTFTVDNGNPNYWLEQPETTSIKIVYEKLVAYVYNESGTGFTTILYKYVVNSDNTISQVPTHLPVPLYYDIYNVDTGVKVIDGVTTKTSTAGVYKASYDMTELTGNFEIVLNAEGYRIVR